MNYDNQTHEQVLTYYKIYQGSYTHVLKVKSYKSKSLSALIPILDKCRIYQQSITSIERINEQEYKELVKQYNELNELAFS